MLNQYPLWKYILLVVVIFFASIFALPNLYGEDPAVQISHRTKSLTDEDKQIVELAIQAKEIAFKSAELAQGRLLVRFNDTESQLIAAEALKDSNLWDEVKDKLFKSAFELSGGQQQRLCIARALAVEPEMLLLDEPASALDPVSTAKLEELLESLKEKYTIIIVTHNLQQASRVSDYTAFMYLGEIIEFGKTAKVFTNPQNEKTENYIRGKYG